MKKTSVNNRITIAIAYAFLAVLAAAYIIPFITMLSASFTDEHYLDVHGYGILPGKFSWFAYSFIFTGNSAIPQGYLISIFVTITGTVFSLIVTSMMAYAISRRHLKYANVISFFVFFTMLFQGGLVPYYLWVSKYLHLTDTIWVLILPSTVNAFNLFLLRTYFSTIDDSMLESAKIDGAKEMRILFSIVIPLSLPGIVTIILFYGLQYWNDWFTALLFINKRPLYPLQYLLRMIISAIDFLSSPNSKIASKAAYAIPSKSVRMATTVVTIGPIILLYPFIQKYFIKGIALGGVKG
jgi:putative aldouronate transport system permease protein